ncbi:MAG: phage tail protein [Phascolarctobacterium sp.]
MLVGYLGGTPFMVSRQYVYTFDDYQRGSSGRYASHDVLGKKPLLEFLGPDAESISFKIKLRSDHGLSPRVELDKLRKYRDTGKVLTLVLGGRVVGRHRWVIESISESVNFWSKTGQILSCDVSLTLKEYRKQVITV